MQSPPFPRYLVPPRSKYSPQHRVLKHPQLPFPPQCQRPSFTPTQNNRQNYISIMSITVQKSKETFRVINAITRLAVLHQGGWCGGGGGNTLNKKWNI